jgi:biopolymer transport protein ExbB
VKGRKATSTLISLSLLLAMQVPLAGLAARAASAETLEDLLTETRKAHQAEIAANAAREQEFLAHRDRQQELLAEAQAKWNAASERSKKLSSEFDANETELTKLDTELKAREGNLGELFGVTRQVAGDSGTEIFNSMTSGQFPGRDAFFTGLAKAKTLPTVDQLEKLSFELLREMTENGRVVRFPAEVVTPNGDTERAEVVRIGDFIAMSGNRFLSYQPEIGRFSVLPRQPSSGLREIAGRLTKAKSGMVEAVIDPSRGALLSLYVERPTLWERIQRGQAVGYVIIAVGVIGALCAIYQFLYLLVVRRRVTRQLAHLDAPVRDNPLGRVLSTFRGDPSRIEDDVEVVELRISEAVLREVPLLERFQAFLRLAVAAGPLLGLIGTVIGMILTFQTITETGSGNPRLMAAGIGQAMIATVLGLSVAIPLLFANAGLNTLSRSVVQVLDEQSNGLLAEHIERKLGDAAARGETHA